MTAPSWKKPKQAHKRMMARLIQTRTHLIFCLRAQEKIKFEKVTDGNTGRTKNEIRHLGFMPICEKSFMFELSGSMTMHPETPGEPRYDLPRKLNHELQAIFPAGERISFDKGLRLKHWAETGEDRPPVDRDAEQARDLVECIQDADQEKLKNITSSAKTQKFRKYLSDNRPDLAERVDDAVQDALDGFASEEVEFEGASA